MPKQAILFIIDGLCAAAPDATPCPAIAGLRRRGASTLTAVSVMPSVTLPCHMTIFHSVPPTRHGIMTNTYQPLARPLPGLIDIAHAAGLRTAAVYNWEPLRDLSRPLSLDYSVCRHDCDTNPQSDEAVAEEAVRLLTRERPDFAFVYFGVLDTIGHRHGFMSGEYLAQLTRTDLALGRVLDAVPDATVLLTSDHGGHGRGHGTDLPEDMTVPWVVDGPEIRRGVGIQAPVSLLDTAPTLAHVLGLRPAREWEGRVVDEAFG